MFASTMMIALEYIYYVGDKIYLLVTIQDKLIWFLFQLCWIALGMFLICRGARDFRRYGRYQLFQRCVCRKRICRDRRNRTGRTMLQEDCASQHPADAEKAAASGGALDAQEGMLLLGEGVKASYQEAWRQWNQKQNVYRKAGVSWEEQEIFLMENSRQRNCGNWPKTSKNPASGSA